MKKYTVVATIQLSGYLINKIGYYNPFQKIGNFFNDIPFEELISNEFINNLNMHVFNIYIIR
jgi:hypothetical protein